MKSLKPFLCRIVCVDLSLHAPITRIRLWKNMELLGVWESGLKESSVVTHSQKEGMTPSLRAVAIEAALCYNLVGFKVAPPFKTVKS